MKQILRGLIVFVLISPLAVQADPFECQYLLHLSKGEPIPRGTSYFDFIRILQKNYGVDFSFHAELPGRPIDQLHEAVELRISKSSPQTPIGAHFTIDEQIALLDLARFLVSVKREDWQSHLIWVHGERRWKLVVRS